MRQRALQPTHGDQAGRERTRQLSQRGCGGRRAPVVCAVHALCQQQAIEHVLRHRARSLRRSAIYCPCSWKTPSQALLGCLRASTAPAAGRLSHKLRQENWSCDYLGAHLHASSALTKVGAAGVFATPRSARPALSSTPSPAGTCRFKASAMDSHRACSAGTLALRATAL